MINTFPVLKMVVLIVLIAILIFEVLLCDMDYLMRLSKKPLIYQN
jgi:hypothetical protein